MNVINIAEKFSAFSDHWNPRIIAELNGQHIKAGKFKGDFTWHSHDNEDEMFMVIKGAFTMHFRDKSVEVKEGEILIVPKGTEHKPSAEEEVHVLLFEPVSTLNTGNIINEFTKADLQEI